LYFIALIDDVHSMPVSQMGNYQEYLKRIAPPLREIESTPVRQHMFGNPFKIDKVSFFIHEKVIFKIFVFKDIFIMVALFLVEDDG